MKFCPNCGVKLTRENTKLDFSFGFGSDKKIIKICIKCGCELAR